MTKEEIKKHWEYYAYWLEDMASTDYTVKQQHDLITSTLDLITEQEKKIDRLTTVAQEAQKYLNKIMEQ